MSNGDQAESTWFQREDANAVDAFHRYSTVASPRRSEHPQRLRFRVANDIAVPDHFEPRWAMRVGIADGEVTGFGWNTNWLGLEYKTPATRPPNDIPFIGLCYQLQTGHL